MNSTDPKYTRFALACEMMEVVDIARRFDSGVTKDVAAKIATVGRLMLTGEGSSRIFPAKNARRKALTWGADVQVATDGSWQSAMYDLAKFAVFAASNSGRTKEIVLLAKKLLAQGNRHVYGLTANQKTDLQRNTVETFVLGCGKEQAVAATKSCVEQGLFYQSIISHIAGRDFSADLAGLDEKLAAALSLPIPPKIVEAAAGARLVCFAGYNDGVAEELTLKVNEITRKSSDYFEGTYLLHGVEDSLTDRDVIFVVEPIAEELDKFEQRLVDTVGSKMFTISTTPMPLPGIVVPDAGAMNPFVFLAAGWNLLVEVGLALGVDLDKPQLARKVGNVMDEQAHPPST